MRLWPGCNCCEETSESSAPCGCTGGIPTYWKVIFDDLANGTCTGCVNYNGLEFGLYGTVNPCVWSGPTGGACIGTNNDYATLVISSITGGIRVTVTLAIYDFPTLSWKFTIWQKDYVGGDCMIYSDFLPLLSDENVLCDNSAATCHISAVP